MAEQMRAEQAPGTNPPARRRRRGKLVRRAALAALPIGALAALGATAFVAPARFLNLLAPTGGVDMVHAVPYGPGPRQTLDVYRPEDAHDAPVVVFIYGGSWQMGSKEMYRFLGAALARRGFVTVVPDYRIYPQVRFPAFVEDGAAALAWARKNAGRYGGSNGKLFVMGHSAGAHIAAMLALDEQWLAREGLSVSNDIAGFIGISGPYDFLPITDSALIDIFGGSERADSQPINFADGNAPPSLLVTGKGDAVVEPGNTRRLAARLNEAGAHAEMHIYERPGHLSLIGAMSPYLQFLAPVLDDVTAFVTRIAGADAAAGADVGRQAAAK